MMLTFLASMGLGVFLGIRMYRSYARAVTICHRIDSQQVDSAQEPRTIDEMLDEIERLNVPERDVEIDPQYRMLGPGSFKIIDRGEFTQ